MWGKVKRPDPATEWRVGIEKAEAQSLWYQAKLFHAWKALREHQKGMQRQARRMKRLRLENQHLKGVIAFERALHNGELKIEVPPDFVDEKDLKLADPGA